MIKIGQIKINDGEDGWFYSTAEVQKKVDEATKPLHASIADLQKDLDVCGRASVRKTAKIEEMERVNSWLSKECNKAAEAVNAAQRTLAEVSNQRDWLQKLTNQQNETLVERAKRILALTQENSELSRGFNESAQMVLDQGTAIKGYKLAIEGYKKNMEELARQLFAAKADTAWHEKRGTTIEELTKQLLIANADTVRQKDVARGMSNPTCSELEVMYSAFRKHMDTPMKLPLTERDAFKAAVRTTLESMYNARQKAVNADNDNHGIYVGGSKGDRNEATFHVDLNGPVPNFVLYRIMQNGKTTFYNPDGTPIDERTAELAPGFINNVPYVPETQFDYPYILSMAASDIDTHSPEWFSDHLPKRLREAAERIKHLEIFKDWAHKTYLKTGPAVSLAELKKANEVHADSVGDAIAQQTRAAINEATGVPRHPVDAMKYYAGRLHLPDTPEEAKARAHCDEPVSVKHYMGGANEPSRPSKDGEASKGNAVPDANASKPSQSNGEPEKDAHQSSNEAPVSITKSEAWYSETAVRMFIGYLSADIVNLHDVEVPKLAESWEDFKKKAPKDGVMHPDSSPLIVTELGCTDGPNDEDMAEEQFWRDVYRDVFNNAERPDLVADRALNEFRERFRGELAEYPTIAQCRKRYIEVFKSDPDFKRAWRDNIAMKFCDFIGRTWRDRKANMLVTQLGNKDIRDQFATELIDDVLFRE